MKIFWFAKLLFNSSTVIGKVKNIWPLVHELSQLGTKPFKVTFSLTDELQTYFSLILDLLSDCFVCEHVELKRFFNSRTMGSKVGLFQVEINPLLYNI